MGLYTQFCAKVLFPLHERLKGHQTVAVFRELERSQWFAPEALAALEHQRLRELLVHAGQTVPYYRELFAKLNFDPATLTCIADLQKIPFLTKSDIRANAEAFKSSSAKALVALNTGGSCGDPLTFFVGEKRISHDVAAKWRAMRWWDVEMGDKELVLWGSPIEVSAQDRVRALRDKLFRSKLLSAFDMSEKQMDDYLAQIRAFAPKRLFGYPTSFWLLAQHAKKRGVRLDDLGVRAVFVTSEMLYDEQRAFISQAFGCPVANEYGGRDAGYMAHECPHGRLHITAEDVLIELVDAHGAPVPTGTAGEVVVTNLASGDFPFIRYRNGDVAVMSDEPCPCGRGLPVLSQIQGRTTDFLVATDGTRVHSAALAYVMRSQRGVESFKITQESLARTDVQVVAGEGFDAAEAQRKIEAHLKSRLGETVQIGFALVDKIPAEKSGKFRYVVSKVAQ